MIVSLRTTIFHTRLTNCTADDAIDSKAAKEEGRGWRKADWLAGVGFSDGGSIFIHGKVIYEGAAFG